MRDVRVCKKDLAEPEGVPSFFTSLPVASWSLLNFGLGEDFKPLSVELGC